MTVMPSRSSRALVHAPQNEVEAPYFVESQTSGLTVKQILGVLRRHTWLIMGTVAVAVAAAAFLVSREVTTYDATAVIRLIERHQVEVGVIPDSPLGVDADPVQSEMMVLTGRSVLGEAVDRKGLRLFSATTSSPASFVDQVEVTLPPDQFGKIRLQFEDDHVSYGPDDDRRSASYGEPIAVDGLRFVVPRDPGLQTATLFVYPREAAIDYVSGSLEAERMRGTGGISVTFTSLDPAIAPRVVNEVVQAYQKINAETASQHVRRQRAFLEEQLRSIDSMLMGAQSDLSGLRSRMQSYSASDRFIAEQSNLIQVEIRQAELQADLRMYENLLNEVVQGRSSGQATDLSALMAMPGISSAPVVSQLFSQLVTFRTEREGMLAGEWARAPTHPEVRRLDALIASTEEKLVEAVQSHVASLRAQVGALGGLRGRSIGKMSDLPRTEVQEVYLTQNLGALQQMGDQLREQYQAVRLEEAAEAGQVEIVNLAPGAFPLQSSPYPKLLLGLLTGLMLGVGIAFLRERMDQSINRPEEIEEMLLVPNLAVIPQASRHLLEAQGSNGDSRSRDALQTEGAEAYRILRTNLLFSQGGLKTLVVTSAAPGEGKTMTAVNLAASCARQGLRVLLMECDLRRPSLGRYFENTGGSDLASVLLETGSWDEAIRPSGVPNLEILLAEKSVPRAAEFLAGPEMKRLLDEVSQRYDMVILDTSPLLVAADATVLGAIADGVLLVVRASQTDRGAIQQAVHQLTLVGARVVGTVLNDPEGAVARYGSYYDYSTEYEIG